MTDVKLCVEVGKKVDEIKRAQRWVGEYMNDRDKALSELNTLLLTNGGREVTLEEVLAIKDED